MAEVVNGYEFTKATRESKYPWGEWLDGRVWKLTSGVDFDTNAATFRDMCFNRVSGTDLKVRTRVKGNVIHLQAYKPE